MLTAKWLIRGCGDGAHRVLDGPSLIDLQRIVRDVPIARHVMDYAVRLVMGTHPTRDEVAPLVKRYVRYGASPRGAQGLVLAAKVRALAEGRFNVSVDDLRTLAAPALRHRIILNFEGEAEGIDIDSLVAQIVESAEAVAVQGKESFLR